MTNTNSNVVSLFTKRHSDFIPKLNSACKAIKKILTESEALKLTPLTSGVDCKEYTFTLTCVFDSFYGNIKITRDKQHLVTSGHLYVATCTLVGLHYRNIKLTERVRYPSKLWTVDTEKEAIENLETLIKSLL